MVKMTRPPVFRPATGPKAVAAQKIAKTGKYRGSSRSRGYDSRWDRLSIAFRKRHPYCLLCAQANRDTLTDLVDHIIPVVDRPDLQHEWSNLAPLCNSCHGDKARFEAEARRLGNIDILKEWVRNPESRPAQFRPMV